MTEMAELERRITAALDRIGAGLDNLDGGDTDVAVAEAIRAQESEMQTLREDLEAEKAANAQLDERVKALHDSQEGSAAAQETLQAEMQALRDTHATELQALRATLETREAELQALQEAQADAEQAANSAQDTELQELRDALEAEKTANAQMEERIKTLHEGQDGKSAELESQVATLREHNYTLKSTAIEAKSQVQQLRKTNQHLQATLQNLRVAAAEGVEPHLINQAMMSELEGLRSVRDADRAEMDDILGALQPLLKEAEDA